MHYSIASCNVSAALKQLPIRTTRLAQTFFSNFYQVECSKSKVKDEITFTLLTSINFLSMIVTYLMITCNEFQVWWSSGLNFFELNLFLGGGHCDDRRHGTLAHYFTLLFVLQKPYIQLYPCMIDNCSIVNLCV